MRYGILLALLFFGACVKDQMPPPPCPQARLLSYKYSLPDTVFIRIDTLWTGRGCDLRTTLKDTAFCNTAGTYEILRYEIDNR